LGCIHQHRRRPLQHQQMKRLSRNGHFASFQSPFS